MDITQAADGRLSGTYQDQHDTGFVDGTYTGEPTCTFRVNTSCEKECDVK